MQKWREKRDHEYILTKFNAMKTKPNEYVLEFINRFNKLYNSHLAETKPPQPTAKVFFVGAFEPEFGSTLRERKSRTLDQIQTNALEVEANFISTGKWKGTVEYGDKRRGKEEASSPGHVKETKEHKLQEMNNLIRNLSKKLVKLKLDNKNPSRQIHPNPKKKKINPHYRRSSLHPLQRDRKDQHDHIQPPLYLEEDPEEMVKETIKV